MAEPVKRNYIAGQWRGAARAIDNINPSDTRDLIGRYAQASGADLDDAVAAAAEAGRRWAGRGLEERQAVLQGIGETLIARASELGELLSREEGKPRAEGIGEVRRAGQFFTYYAAEVLRQIGDCCDSVRPGVEVSAQREPIGVVGVISPWNFPLATASWKIAPALAFGNAVIWKPANLCPASALALTEIIAAQDIPPGLFNLVMGSGAEVGAALAAHPGVDAISFTGSVPVGRQIAAAAVANFTKIQAEMGSKNALAVMDDADLDTAVACALNGAFGGSGQKCTASSRLVVHRAVHEAFVERLVAGARRLRVGHALAEGTEMGPVVSAGQLADNLANVALAQREGGELLCGGEALERDCPGHYMSPAVVVGTANDWVVNREELFAPIACVIAVDSYDEALATVNDTRFGLSAGIVTASLSRASHFRRHARSGCVMVNLPTAGTDYHVPFGGRGESSYGPREQGRYAVEFYTALKTCYSAAGAPG